MIRLLCRGWRAQRRIARQLVIDDWVAVIGAVLLFVAIGLGAIFGGAAP